MSNVPHVPVPAPLCPVEAAIDAEIERRRRACAEILAAAPVPLEAWIRMRLLVAEAADAKQAGLPVCALVGGAVAAIEELTPAPELRRG